MRVAFAPQCGSAARHPRAALLLSSSARLGVFAGELRGIVGVGAGGLLRRRFVALQTGAALPFAVQLVLDVEGEPAQTLDLDLDLVAVHERVEAAVVGAGGYNVAGLQRVDRGQPLDA